MNINKVMLAGNITKKPVIKELENGMKITSITVAVNQAWKDTSTGEKKEHTDFIDVTIFGKLAENCAQYLDQGQGVYVEGKIKNRAIEDRGEKRYKTGVLADSVTFGRKATGEKVINVETEERAGPTAKADYEYPENDVNPDDIPF